MAGWKAAFYPADLYEFNGLLCLCHAVYEYFGGCPPGDQRLALAGFSMGLYDGIGVPHGFWRVSGRPSFRMAMKFQELKKGRHVPYGTWRASSPLSRFLRDKKRGGKMTGGHR